MKIKSIYKIAAFSLIIFSLGVIGCQKDILDENPPHLITTETLYTSVAGFDAGLNGLYSLVRMEREGGNGARLEIFMNGTDNLTPNSDSKDIGNWGEIPRFWGDRLNAQDVAVRNHFRWLYSVVNAANTIITQAERKDVNWIGTGGTAEENKNRIIAEARAIRAWAYRHLSGSWGDVPLSLEEAKGSTIKTDWVRTPVEEVRRQILSDLLFAEKHIPVERTWRGRLTKGAVQHYVSEMYLYFNKPDSALYWADKVISTPQYKLITARYGVKKSLPGVAVHDMWIEGNENRDQGNTEALWVFQFALNTLGGGSSSGGWRRIHASRYADMVVKGVRPLRNTYERGGRGATRMSLTNWAISIYEPQDERASPYAMRKYFILNDATKNAPYPADRLPAGYNYGDTIWCDWGKTVGVNEISPTNRINVRRPFMRKVEGADPNNPDSDGGQFNDQVYLRLAETYLLKAEAQFLLGDLPGAAVTLNAIRTRSKATPITAAQVNIDFILDERSRELVAEEHRRYTLIRTGKLIERARKYNFNGGQLITERDQLYPIPQEVIDANLTGVMPQNPGFN
ncbi:MAG: RagB/SusD family nutrient uptake outer membrane protein [Bacteroidales bacterium]|nr:RagB/SusD family nutrient uptake outer membrane protein [Bacteroidales bacterium]MBK7628064.1 RagB/SusD family nutrient uptake outer membrane protein [Bacteroidales bacterium]